MNKCMVTGAAGFIGSHMVRRLKELGCYVVGVDNLSGCDKESGLERSLCNIRYGQADSFYYKDCGNFEELQKIKKREGKISTIFHIGALPRVQFSIAEPIKTHVANIDATFHLLLAARDIFSTNRFVFSSSSSIFGNQDTLPLREDMKPNPLSPYALHKLTGEYYCKQFFDIYGLETISLRYFNVYGPRQDPTSDYSALIPKFTKLYYNNISPTIYGDGDQTRDMTYISDVVEANIRASITTNSKAFGNIFNIGSGSSHSVNDVSNIIRKELRREGIFPQYGDPVVESRHTRADISKAFEILEWSPETEFNIGIKKTIEYIIGDIK